TADESAHDITLLLVARLNAVYRQEACCPQVVGDNTHTLSIFVVGFARNLLELLDNRPQQAYLEDIRAVDAGSRDALQAAAEVDVLLGQRLKAAVFETAILHEDLIANFHEPPAV